MYLVAQLYDAPRDSAALDGYLSGERAKTIQEQPGLEHFTINWCDPGQDGSPPPFHAIVLSYWADKDQAVAAMAAAGDGSHPAADVTTLWARCEQKRPFAAASTPGNDEIASSVGVYNQPEDPAAFDAHFRSTHSEYAAAIPGVASFTMSWTEPAPDGTPPAYYFVSALEWNSRDELNAGMSGPETATAVADIPNLGNAGMHMTVGRAQLVT